MFKYLLTVFQLAKRKTLTADFDKIIGFGEYPSLEYPETVLGKMQAFPVIPEIPAK